MTPSPILVAVDLSDCSPGLVRDAADFARRLGTGLTLLHVIQPTGGSSVPLHGKTGEELLLEESEQSLEQLSAPLQGVEVQHISRCGDIGATILEVVDALRPTLLMVGTHGRTGVHRLLLGSISEYVIRRAQVPVLSVRTRHHEGCAARSCAGCTSHVTDIERALSAEMDG
jgi:nucleotide-binding universal stress UspA family protein